MLESWRREDAALRRAVFAAEREAAAQWPDCVKVLAVLPNQTLAACLSESFPVEIAGVPFLIRAEAVAEGGVLLILLPSESRAA